MCSILVVLQSDLPLSVNKRSVDDYFCLSVFFSGKGFQNRFKFNQSSVEFCIELTQLQNSNSVKKSQLLKGLKRSKFSFHIGCNFASNCDFSASLGLKKVFVYGCVCAR